MARNGWLSMPALALALAGCALAPRESSQGLVAPQRVDSVAVVGASTGAQLRAALGEPASVIAFDSGFQVWRYVLPGALPGATPRSDGSMPPGEYVLLFDGGGVLRKTRRLGAL